MEYFLMKPFAGGCKLKIVNHDKDILLCAVTKKGELPDFALRPCPLISNRFKELLEQYIPSMDFTPCVIEGEGSPALWSFQPVLQEVSRARFRQDGSVSAVQPMGLWPLFTVPNYKKVSYVINLALAESLLRRGYVNLELERIETIGGGKDGW